ncbi:hypothetical protein LC55x_5681 [Lysobacter capsici]|nr:hypothetical protein LC55x_5681 [Lysobacter capsici]
MQLRRRREVAVAAYAAPTGGCRIARRSWSTGPIAVMAGFTL